jgi:DNA-binding transcriptional MerR regulator
MPPTEIEIPDKRYFRISEVTAITGIEPYVLRYWESEFPKVSPARSRSGQRLYKRGDIETILLVKDLLYQKKYTIAGAKKFLAKRKVSDLQAGQDQPLTLEELRDELKAIQDLLSR